MWAALEPIIRLLLEAVLGVFVEKISEPYTATTATRDPERTERLRDRVRRAKSSSGSSG